MRIVTPESPEALRALPAQHGAPAGRGGHAALSRHAVRHRSGDRRGLLLRLRRRTAVRAGRPRDDREEDEGAGGAGPALRAADVAARRGDRSSSRRRGEPLKVQLIEEKTDGQAEVSCYTIKDRDTFVDFCVGPHVPSTGRLKAFKLLTHLQRVLEGRRAQPADAARLRHGVLQRRGAEGAPAARSRKRRSATIASSARISACSCSTRGRPARRSGCARARRSTTCSPTTCGTVLFPAGYVEVKTPLIFNKALWETSGHWQHYRQNMFLVESDERADGPQGDELPGAHPRLRERGPQLPRSAAPAVTSRRRCIATRRRACCRG